MTENEIEFKLDYLLHFHVTHMREVIVRMVSGL
jgi:hypothetical protein